MCFSLIQLHTIYPIMTKWKHVFKNVGKCIEHETVFTPQSQYFVEAPLAVMTAMRLFTLKCAVCHITQVLRKRAIGMLTAGMSTRAVAREFNVTFSTISRLQHCFGEFGSTSNRPHNRRPHAWRHVGEQFADVNFVNRVPPWWQWGYGNGRHKLRTTNTIAF